MKEERKATASVETCCERLGELAALATDDRPDPRQWAKIDRLLGDHSRRGALLRLGPAFAVSVVLLACVGGWFGARRTLGYSLEGCSFTSNGSLTATASQGGTIAFEDGSRVLLAQNAQVQLRTLRFKRGVEIDLRDGEASLSVAHRIGTHWAIFAGAFRVDVTGTRFAVNWSESTGRFRLAMIEGEVRVSGGVITGATMLHSGQSLTATKSTVEVTDKHDVEPEPSHSGSEASTRAALAAQANAIPPSPPHTRREPSTPSLRQRSEINAEAITGEMRAAQTSQRSSKPASKLAALNLLPSASVEYSPLSVPEFQAVVESEAAHARVAKPTAKRVTIGADGQLSGGFTGLVWVAKGEGTKLTTPKRVVWEDRTPLRPEQGLLCTRGTVAALSCANEGMPSAVCNWSLNWGVAVGFFTRADENAWGSEAATAMAIEFRGRSSTYRLNAHRKGDPPEKLYCIENYKSGQVVKSSMFQSPCSSNSGASLPIGVSSFSPGFSGPGTMAASSRSPADDGEIVESRAFSLGKLLTPMASLPNFEGVDYFNLQFPSGMNYVAFRYCIAGITVYPFPADVAAVE